MKAYVITAGVLFALLTLVHVWRIVEEGMQSLANPFFIVSTAISTAMSVWALLALRSPASRRE